MKNVKTTLFLIPSLALVLIGSTAFAAHNKPTPHKNQLQSSRLQTVYRYVSALEQADATAMAAIFTEDGELISTSRGHMSAVPFFTGFFPEIDAANLEIGSVYKSVTAANEFGASFNFQFTTRDGEQHGGHFIDEFIFEKNSDKLKMVIMYENTQY